MLTTQETTSALRFIAYITCFCAATVCLSITILYIKDRKWKRPSDLAFNVIFGIMLTVLFAAAAITLR